MRYKDALPLAGGRAFVRNLRPVFHANVHHKVGLAPRRKQRAQEGRAGHHGIIADEDVELLARVLGAHRLHDIHFASRSCSIARIFKGRDGAILQRSSFHDHSYSGCCVRGQPRELLVDTTPEVGQFK